MFTEEELQVQSARTLSDKCTDLILLRPKCDNNDFARMVFQSLFAGDVDLLSVQPHFHNAHADASNRLIGLIGFDSSVFKTIYTNETLFDDFIRVFANHAIRSKQSPAAARESIYVWLLNGYLNHILPLDEAKLNVIKNTNWLSSPFSLSSANSRSNTPAMSSPRRLLKPEVLAASYPLEHVGVRSASLRTLYPRLVQFLGGLIKYLSSLTTWPSLAQCEILKVIITHYHDFILSDTEDADFAALKMMLISKSLFASSLQTFVERLLTNWPLNPSYNQLIELWLTITFHRSLSGKSEEKRKQFLDTSTRHFIGYVELVVDRLNDADCAILLRSQVLDYLEQNLFGQSQRYAGVLKHFGISLAQLVELIVSKLMQFKEHQRMLDGAKESGNWLVKLAHFVASISEWPDADMNLLDRHVDVLTQTFHYLLQVDDASNITAISSLPNDTASMCSTPTAGTIPSPSTAGGRLTSHSLSAAGDCSASGSRQWPSAQHNNSIMVSGVGESKVSEMPDHEVDPWTKMLFLTPAGRSQVLSRRARFDYTKCSQEIAQTFPQVHRWEISELAHWLHLLSIRWSNCWLVNYLRRRSQESFVSRKVAHLLLCAPSPPKYVPVFSRYVPKRSHRLNLRIFASVPFLICCLVTTVGVLYFLWRMFTA